MNKETCTFSADSLEGKLEQLHSELALECVLISRMIILLTEALAAYSQGRPITLQAMQACTTLLPFAEQGKHREEVTALLQAIADQI